MNDSRVTAIEAVYDEHAQKLYKFFYFKVVDQHTAEDLTSETFLALANKIHELDDDPLTVKKYMYGIARNLWNGYLREKYKNKEMLVEDIEDFEQFVDEETEATIGRSLQERALYFINLLPPKQKIVATLRLIDGLTPTEISTKISKPINYVKVTLRRALRRLEELIAGARSDDASRKGKHE